MCVACKVIYGTISPQKQASKKPETKMSDKDGAIGDDDDDDAPESVSLSTGRERVKVEEQQINEEVKQMRERVREQRKRRHEKNRLQQEAKVGGWVYSKSYQLEVKE